jgi:hypothetical protein
MCGQGDASQRYDPNQQQRDVIVRESALSESRGHMADPHPGRAGESFARDKTLRDCRLGDPVRGKDDSGK